MSKALRKIVKKAPTYTPMFFGFIGRHGGHDPLNGNSDPTKNEGLVTHFKNSKGQTIASYSHYEKSTPQGKYEYHGALKDAHNYKKYVKPGDKVTAHVFDHPEVKSEFDHKVHKNNYAKEYDYVNRMHNSLRDHYDDFEPHHHKAITDYTTGSESKKMNAVVLGTYDSKYGMILSRAKQYYVERVNHLKEALTRYSAPHDFAVHTGLTESAIKHLHQTPGENQHGHFKIHLPAFTSTSLSRRTAIGFSRTDDHDHNHYVTIHIPKGAHGAYIAGHSSNPIEKEFILHPGAKVHIDRHPKIDGKNINWIGRLVHDGVKDLT